MRSLEQKSSDLGGRLPLQAKHRSEDLPLQFATHRSISLYFVFRDLADHAPINYVTAIAARP